MPTIIKRKSNFNSGKKVIAPVPKFENPTIDKKTATTNSN